MPHPIRPRTSSLIVCALSALLAARGAQTAPSPTDPAGSHAPTATAVPVKTSAPSQATATAAGTSLVSPMSGAEIIQMLDETIDWYRTLGSQQQLADEPSDQLILAENRQVATQVATLAFDVARASATLVGKSDSDQQSGASASSQSLADRQRAFDAQANGIQSEIDADRAKLPTTPVKSRTALEAKIAELNGELDLVNTKKSILASVVGVLSGNDPSDAGALRSQIEAMAVALPAVNGSGSGASAAGTAPARATVSAAANPLAAPLASRFGLWDEAEEVYKLSQKAASISTLDRRTQHLQDSLNEIRKRLVDEMRTLSAQGDSLMAQADSADSAKLDAVRSHLDALAGQFKQAAGLVVPLSKQIALLDQYRHNLRNWRDAVQSQVHGSLKLLGVRVAVLLVVVGVVFALAEIWHRAVLKYVQDSRRRYQLLLLRRIALWSLIVIIVAIAFASELGSVVTFAGLITAGLAVAMQSVLVSMVGYFFLIGKYGLRVGDRVQIGEVNGEIIEIGLVRMYLMELSGRVSGGPTGRVAAFPNSVVFQVSSGLFKQIPGVSFAWHDITLSVPPGVDDTSIKEKLFAAANEALADYREEIERQSRELERTTLSSSVAGAALPTVQLTYSVQGVDAHVHYPVHVPHAAEIDERMSRSLLQVISGLTPENPVR